MTIDDDAGQRSSRLDWDCTVLVAVACVRCIDDVAVESVDVTRANQRRAGASLHALD